MTFEDLKIPETKSGRNRLKIFLERADRFQYIAAINPFLIRQIWLLHQYYSYRVSVSFSEAEYSIKEYVSFYTTRTSYSWSTRTQKLGKLRELKQDEFLDLAKQRSNIWHGLNMIMYCLTVGVDELLIGNFGLFGEEVSLKTDEWKILLGGDLIELENLKIALPCEVERKLYQFIENL